MGPPYVATKTRGEYRNVRRNTQLAVTLTAIVASAIGGWAAGRQVRSPAEIAARTASPRPSLIAVPVESRRLSSDVTARGTVGYRSPLEVTLAASAVKQGNSIVTVAPQKGALLNEGGVALAVSARPVLVLQGEQPTYRDLGFRSVGHDVAQLEAGLARLGLDPGPQDGLYDGRTATAVAALYGAAGWAPAGGQVPADELLFFPSLPLRVDDAKVRPGETPSGPVMTVTSPELTVAAALSGDDVKLVREGAAVAIDDPDQGVRATGTVGEVATTPGTRGVDPQRFFVEVIPRDAPESLIGASVVLTIAVSSTEADVLAVPVAALSASADGTTRLEVQLPDLTTRSVTVTPGLVARGLAAVTPVDGALAPGDLVVVGAAPGPGTSPTTQPTTSGGNSAP